MPAFRDPQQLAGTGQRGVQVGRRKPADQGYANAQVNLGNKYPDGPGVPKDDQQAVAWYRKAADQGNSKAQITLVYLYANGLGVPKDYQQAHFWVLLANVLAMPT